MARSRSIGNVYAELSLRDTKFQKGIKSARAGLNSFAKSSMKYGAMAAAGGIALFTKSAISAASDMEETLSKSNTVFGNSAGEMEMWAETAARSFGQSNLAALESAATIGNMFVAMGMGGDKAASMSRAMVELGSDLASFNNTAPEDAILAIGSALRGESEPIRRYGVLLNEATLKAKAFEMGLYGGKGALDPATKALAAYQVILDQTKTAQGDFSKTSDGLANSTRTLAALWQDATVAAGEGLLPVMQDLVATMKDIDFTVAGEQFSILTKKAMQFAEALGKVAKLNPFYWAGYGAEYLMNDGGNMTDADRKKAAAEAAKMADPNYVRQGGDLTPFGERLSTMPDSAFAPFKAFVGSLDGLTDVMTNQATSSDIPLWLQKVDEIEAKQQESRDWQESAYDVNSQQARGLSMGGTYIDKEGREQVALLSSIKDILKLASTNGSLVWN